MGHLCWMYGWSSCRFAGSVTLRQAPVKIATGRGGFNPILLAESACCPVVMRHYDAAGCCTDPELLLVHGFGVGRRTFAPWSKVGNHSLQDACGTACARRGYRQQPWYLSFKPYRDWTAVRRRRGGGGRMLEVGTGQRFGMERREEEGGGLPKNRTRHEWRGQA